MSDPEAALAVECTAVGQPGNRAYVKGSAGMRQRSRFRFKIKGLHRLETGVDVVKRAVIERPCQSVGDTHFGALRVPALSWTVGIECRLLAFSV